MVRPVIRARDVLGPGSPLSRALPGWEHREGQLAMAEGVERALQHEQHLFVEAGTGTGKTLAYLVPAVLSGRKVIVSTATRALQEQIFVKDLPIVAEALAVHGIQFRAAMMKGLSNYVCLRRLGEARASGERAGGSALARIADWAQTSETGDRAELSDLAEDAEIWREVASSSETRIGANCEHYEACFITRMRREAEDAQVVVVNHHLLLADLALRTGRRGQHASVLPPYDAIVFDEAHQVEDVATDFFGVRVSSARVDAFLRDAERALGSANALEALKSGPVRSTLESAREAAKSLFGRLLLDSSAGASDARRMLRDSDVTAAVRDAHDALDVRLEALEAIARSKGAEEALVLVSRRASELRDDLKGILQGTRVEADGEVSDVVRWIDVRSRSVSLGSSPVEVGATLRTRLFDRVATVVCTSATLATGSSCHFAKARLGAPPEAEELIVPSPFDFAARAALYLPDDLPEPADPRFEEAAAERIGELVTMTGGGAFVLCTSARAMRALSGRLRNRFSFPLMVQGERPKHLLLSRFRASGKGGARRHDELLGRGRRPGLGAPARGPRQDPVRAPHRPRDRRPLRGPRSRRRQRLHAVLGALGGDDAEARVRSLDPKPARRGHRRDPRQTHRAQRLRTGPPRGSSAGAAGEEHRRAESVLGGDRA